MRILCVEDDLILSDFIAKHCREFGEVIKCHNLNTAIKEINSSNIFDYALIDLNLGDTETLDGLDILQTCIRKNTKLKDGSKISIKIEIDN